MTERLEKKPENSLGAATKSLDHQSEWMVINYQEKTS